MNDSCELIIKLIRTAFGGKTDFTSVSEINWDEISAISQEQGVTGIVLDGIRRIQDNIKNIDYQDIRNEKKIVDSFYSQENEQTKFNIFAIVSELEKKFIRQWETACDVANILKEQNITTYCMKGFSLAQYYPKPSHRPGADFDCILEFTNCKGTNSKFSSSDLGDEILRFHGAKVSNAYYKHSKIKFHGLIIENHKHIIPIGFDKKTKKFENHLHSILNLSSKRIRNSNIYSPSPQFNALYILSHTKEHFLNDGMMLRHICDWGVILKAYSKQSKQFEETNISSEEFWEQWKNNCTKFELLEFGYVMSNLANLICDINIPFECPKDVMTEKLVLEDIFKTRPNKQNGFKRRIQIVKNIIGNSWKFRTFSHNNAMKFVIHRILSYIFR